jgi:hypothetical protein
LPAFVIVGVRALVILHIGHLIRIYGAKGFIVVYEWLAAVLLEGDSRRGYVDDSANVYGAN